MPATHAGGMDDIVAAETAITWIDGTKGELRYRGYPIGELAEHCTFEQVAYLLWNGDLPSADEARALSEEIRSMRVERASLVDLVSEIPTGAHPLDVLRYIVSWDALRNPGVWDYSAAANRRKALEMTAWFPVVAAAYHRRRQGLTPVRPRPDLDTAASFLHMLYGEEAGEDQVRTLDTSLILHADHELNASTFSARVTIATQSNLHAAIASALGTLTGPRHGGASERVIQMLEAIGTPDNVEPWLSEMLSRKERVMGFGHRVYRTADPRSRHLRVMAERILAGTENEHWIAILERLGAAMEREKHLYPNVDLYAAVVNSTLGIDPAFYTSVFAISRIAGWTAHTIEQLGGRMIRPAAQYTGPELRHVNAVAGVS